MLKNYLSHAIRVFSRDKFYTLLNLSGLAVGISCGIIILLYLQHELSYDTHHLQHANIYRVGSHFTTEEIDARIAGSSSMLTPLMKQEYPAITAFVRFRPNGRSFLQFDGPDQNRQRIYEEDIWFADSSIFQVFTHEFVAGDPTACLKDINSIVLTESLAISYFGEEAVKSGIALGKEISIDNTYTCKLTGIIRDVPTNQHLRFDGLISYPTLFKGAALSQQRIKQMLWNTSDFSYVLFPPSYLPNQILDQFSPFFEKYMGEMGSAIGARFVPVFEPLTKIHFGSTLMDDLQRGNATYLYAFGLVGALLLLLACINYMNLATARSARRAREVGLRKVLGAEKALLIGRFIGESVLLAMLAFVLATILVEAVLNLLPISEWMGTALQLSLLNQPALIAYALLLSMLVGIISGVYPAFFLASIQPVKVLKGVFFKSAEGNLLRRILVGAQFVISIGVVIVTLLMQAQIEFVRISDLGFDKDNMLIIPVQGEEITEQLPALKNELRKQPGVKNIAFAQQVPGKMDNSQVYHVENVTGVIEKQLFPFNYVDYDYLETMGLKLVHGRNFDKGITTDVGKGFIVNESLVRKMGWENPLGKKLSNDFADDGSAQNLGQVIGVIEDFHTTSLHNPVEPLILRLMEVPRRNIHIKIASQNIAEVLAEMENQWHKLGSAYPFEYYFLDQDFDKMYKSDERHSQLLSLLAIICIFISCLGLFGLTSFATAQRTKEIGIRKVLGASTQQIIGLLFKDIFTMILLAIIIAAPLAWVGINYWLEGFAFKMNIQPYVFIITALGAIVIAFVSVGFHILKVARANPANALSYE